MYLSSDTSSELTGKCVLWCAQVVIPSHQESTGTSSFSILLDFFTTETMVRGG